MLGVIGGTAEWIFTLPRPHLGHRSAAPTPRRRGPRRPGRAALGRCRQGAEPRPRRCRPGRSSRKSAPPSPPRRSRTPARPAARTRWRNLFLAGDWTQTGLPATIEGAVRSGDKAAALALRHLSLIIGAMNQLSSRRTAELEARHPRRHRRAAARSSGRTAIGSLSWKPTPPSRPNMCCWCIIWPRRRTWSWSARSASICAASRATMAAGRCITTAPSTSPRR